LGRLTRLEWFKKADYLPPASSEGLPIRVDWVARPIPRTRVGTGDARVVSSGNPSAYARSQEERRTASNVDADRWNSGVAAALWPSGRRSPRRRTRPVVKPGATGARARHRSTGVRDRRAEGWRTARSSVRWTVCRQSARLTRFRWTSSSPRSRDPRIACACASAAMPSSRAGLRTAEDYGLFVDAVHARQPDPSTARCDRTNEWLLLLGPAGQITAPCRTRSPR
jgi:hypothetical protein